METSQIRRGRPKAWTDKTEQNTIKSLDRAMEVFDHLSTMPGATLSKLASDLDQSAATVYRILVTLDGRGLVELDAETQMWHIGPRAFLIGARYLRRTSLVDRARPILRQLMTETEETANLAVARDGSVIFVSQVECHNSIRAFFPPGTISPMHASGIGKALMAQMPPDLFDAHLYRAVLTEFTQHTITDTKALAREMERIRSEGFAIDDQEKNIGMRCIAAPVFDWNGEAVAGLSVSGPVSRIGDDQIPPLAEAVRRAAHDLSAALGADQRDA